MVSARQLPLNSTWSGAIRVVGRFLPENAYFPPDPAPGDTHPEATQFNVDSSTQAATQLPAGQTLAPVSFAGIAQLAQQAPPPAGGASPWPCKRYPAVPA